MSLRLRAALVLGLLTPALAPANPIVAPSPWSPARSQPGPGPGECRCLLSNRDGPETVLHIPAGFLTSDGGPRVAPGEFPRSPFSVVVTGVALAAAVSLIGVGLARSRYRRALVGSAACVLAGVLLVNSSCSPVPRNIDPLHEETVKESTTEDKPDGRVILTQKGLSPVLQLGVGQDLRARAERARTP
jgi:hypothetical protein